MAIYSIDSKDTWIVNYVWPYFIDKISDSCAQLQNCGRFISILGYILSSLLNTQLWLWIVEQQ